MALKMTLPALATASMISLSVYGETPDPAQLQELYLKTQRLQQQLVKQDLYLKALQERIRQLELEKAKAALPESREGVLQVSADNPPEPLQPASDPSAGKVRLLSSSLTLSYTPYQKKELIYNGFLALDSIFLGEINIDRVNSETFTYSLNHQFALGERWQLQATMPFVSRSTEYETAGSNYSSGELETDRVSGSALGDISLGLSYLLKRQPQSRYSLTWSLGGRLPTGKSPYGIESRQSESGNLSAPGEIATGNGLWGLSTALAIAKTLDPVVIFANTGYTHNFRNKMKDISSQAGSQPGTVKLGDSLSYGFGMSYAINRQVSTSLSFSQSMTREAEQKFKGGQFQKLEGSDANVANLGLGFNVGLPHNMSLNNSVSMGLTPDSPDYSVSLKLAFTPK